MFILPSKFRYYYYIREETKREFHSNVNFQKCLLSPISENYFISNQLHVAGTPPLKFSSIEGGRGRFDTLFLLNETWARGNVRRRWRYIFPLVFSYKKLKWLKLVRFLRPFSKDYYFTDGLTELRNNNRSILKCSKTLKMFLVPKYHLLHRYKNALFFFSFFSLFFFLLLFSHAKATATKVKLKRATISLPYYTRTKPIDSMGQPKIKRYNIQA